MFKIHQIECLLLMHMFKTVCDEHSSVCCAAVIENNVAIFSLVSPCDRETD